MTRNSGGVGCLGGVLWAVGTLQVHAASAVGYFRDYAVGVGGLWGCCVWLCTVVLWVLGLDT